MEPVFHASNQILLLYFLSQSWFYHLPRPEYLASSIHTHIILFGDSMDHQILKMLTFPVFKNCPLLCVSLFSCSQCSIIDKYFLSTFYMSDILEALGIQGGDKVWIHPTWVKKYFNLSPFQIVLLVTIWIRYSLAWNWLLIIYKIKPNLNPNVYETRFLSTFLVLSPFIALSSSLTIYISTVLKWLHTFHTSVPFCNSSHMSGIAFLKIFI